MKPAIFLICLILLLSLSKPTAQVPPVDYPAVCFSCHEENQTILTKKHVHEVYKKGKCQDCHNPHASKHEDLLNMDPGKLCVSCHEKMKEKLTDTTMVDNTHKPFTEGECMACHDPHATDIEKVLTSGKTSLCTRCHQKSVDMLKKKFVHAPVGKKCYSCHDPHASKNRKILKDSIPDLCWKCHKLDSKIKQIHAANFSAEVNCLSCHNPHSSDLKGLLMAKQHKPYKEGKCDDCHATKRGDLVKELKFNQKELCNKCHKKIAAFEKMPFKHIMDKPAACMACHFPHASENDSLLRFPPKELCSGCHLKGKSAAEKVRFTTHPDFNCNRCHEPHGSDNGQYLRIQGSELCLQCHTKDHGSHPLGTKAMDPRTKMPLTCLGCHVMHNAPFPKYLPKNPDKELCLQCHKK